MMVDSLVLVHWESCEGTGRNRIYRANGGQYRLWIRVTCLSLQILDSYWH